MCNGTIMDKLISFSFPLMLTSILQLMFNAVDIIVVGRFSGSQSLAAVGSTTASSIFLRICLSAFPLEQRACGPLLCGRKRQGDVRGRPYGDLSGADQWSYHGCGSVGASRFALTLMGTPDDVIDLSVLYMRIYFMGMPFFMLYNYGAAILRAVGDTKRPLFYLIAAGLANVVLDLLLVIVIPLNVAGVAVGTVASQMVSCILVLRCLYRTEGSYQLRFSRLTIKSEHLKMIFQVGVPAGIQSTVINFSNALLQSSVNSFGSTAMAGYTAANNIIGFLYSAVNAVTQACMSFTSQNYSVGKPKRMDRVLVNCIILTVSVSAAMGIGAYAFGGQLLKIYTSEADVIRCGLEVLSITTVPYFLCGIMDLFPGAMRGMGHSGVPMILSVIGTVGTRIVWVYLLFPHHRSLYFLFISYPASWILTIIMQAVCFYFVRKQCRMEMHILGGE